MSSPFRLVTTLACTFLLILAGATRAATPPKADTSTGLLFYLSGELGTTADYAASGQTEPNFANAITRIADGAHGPALSCAHNQTLAYLAPGNIYAQRGTLSFFWRAREATGPTEFAVFRVAFADHSSWDMAWLRIDYNGHGFDAFVTDASLSRIRVSTTLTPFPQPDQWTHLALTWDETVGIRLYVNGQLAAQQNTRARLDTGLDQFGPHSRIISPINVQSDYNFMRGGDLDELRIYDHALTATELAVLASGTPAPAATASTAPAPLSPDNSAIRDAWAFRHGWNRLDTPPPLLTDATTTVRKVEILQAYDLKRWWWKATDGIRETTWPGVYNRSRLPGRTDYLILPDWDCYSVSGKSLRLVLPDEPVNHLEISGAAWGSMIAQPHVGAAGPTTALFDRPVGQERTSHRLNQALTATDLVFTNIEAEQPIGELSAYYVHPGAEPRDQPALSYVFRAQTPAADAPSNALTTTLARRFPPAERAALFAIPAHTAAAINSPEAALAEPALPVVHLIIPADSSAPGYRLADDTRGLDGIALDLPALDLTPTHGDVVPFTLQVHDPLWPDRVMLDFSFSLKPHQPRTLWLDLRDRILPANKPLYLTLSSASPQFNSSCLTTTPTQLRLLFKPRAAALAEHIADRFTQARDAYAMITEEHTSSPKLNLWNRFSGDILDLLRAAPDHELGRIYASRLMPEIKPLPFVQPTPSADVPLWAFRQVTALAGLNRIVNWYIDHRQIENGEFGGGISDDTDLTNLWPGTALMGCEPEKITASVSRLLDACYANNMLTRGLPTNQSDELHGYEEGINCIGQNLILQPGSPRQLERAMESARSIIGLTDTNAAGHRHFTTSYFSATRMARDSVWAYQKAYQHLLLQPALLVAAYNDNPTARSFILEMADSLLAHRRVDEKGRASFPSAIHFETDRSADFARSYFPAALFWGAWKYSGNERYLTPIFDGGSSTAGAINADALNQLSAVTLWDPTSLISPESRPTDNRAPGDFRKNNRVQNFRNSSSNHFAWQLTGDKRHLEALYAQQIEQMARLEYINTEGSIWIDRVALPNAELQRARLGGIALLRNSILPGHTVSWRFPAPDSATSLALLLPVATPSEFKVIAYNLETHPVTATLTGCDIAPGQWEITQGIDTNDDDEADLALATSLRPFERTQSMPLTFPPRAQSVLTFKLKTPGTPYSARPDLGFERNDVVLKDLQLTVTLHSLGAVPTPTAHLILCSSDGRELARAAVPSLPAPLDLIPKTTSVTLTLPVHSDLAHATLDLRPDAPTEELATDNNHVTL